MISINSNPFLENSRLNSMLIGNALFIEMISRQDNLEKIVSDNNITYPGPAYSSTQLEELATFVKDFIQYSSENENYKAFLKSDSQYRATHNVLLSKQIYSGDKKLATSEIQESFLIITSLLYMIEAHIVIKMINSDKELQHAALSTLTSAARKNIKELYTNPSQNMIFRIYEQKAISTIITGYIIAKRFVTDSSITRKLDSAFMKLQNANQGVTVMDFLDICDSLQDAANSLEEKIDVNVNVIQHEPQSSKKSKRSMRFVTSIIMITSISLAVFLVYQFVNP
jgi:hypothetical protein